MITYLVLSLIIVAFLLGCYEDIRKREIYDYLNFALAFMMLIIAIFHSMIIESFDPIKYVTFGMIVGFCLGALLFYIGIWGGGDAKFLLGFSASTYYLKGFVESSYSPIVFMYDYAMNQFSIFLKYLLDTFLTYIIHIDLIFLILILVQFKLAKRKSERKNLLFLLSVFSLLMIGLYLNLKPINLVIIGFVAFVLIFLAKEGVFDSVYFNYRKHIKELHAGDKIDDDIIINGKKIVDYETGKLGLTKEQVHNIKDVLTSKNEKTEIFLRKALPFSSLIILNYVLYIFKIITIDNQNLAIISYLFKYLFYSFMAGGALAVLVVLYYFFKNYSRVHLKFNKIELLVLSILLIFPILVFLITNKFLILLMAVPLYLFVKMAKAIEGVAFVNYKKLDEIALGDWIVQDITLGNDKVIYHKEDFKIGIDEIQLAKIKELSKDNPKLKKLLVKDGIAFLPALFIGYIMMWIFK